MHSSASAVVLCPWVHELRFLCPDVEDPGLPSVKAGTRTRQKGRPRSPAGSHAPPARTPPVAGPAWQLPLATPCPGLRVAVARALALAMAGALFRFGGVLVIRYQNGGLSGPQADAPAASKRQGESCSLQRA